MLLHLLSLMLFLCSTVVVCISVDLRLGYDPTVGRRIRLEYGWELCVFVVLIFVFAFVVVAENVPM